MSPAHAYAASTLSISSASRGDPDYRPRAAQRAGKVERSHRIDDEEFYRMLAGVVIDDSKLFNAKLQEWERIYNFQRPHGSLGGQTPYERLRQLTRPSV